MHEHRAALGVSSITVAGESGGGNLTLATALRAKRDGTLHMIDGVYAMVPYISGAYADPPPALASLVENEGYFLERAVLGVMASALRPRASTPPNPLCWPYYAEADDLAGLPPHVISVCELDPLRDEGAAYYRKLAAAGVSARGRTVLGVCHAGDLIFRRDIPENYWATLNDIHAFCDYQRSGSAASQSAAQPSGASASSSPGREPVVTARRSERVSGGRRGARSMVRRAARRVRAGPSRPSSAWPARPSPPGSGAPARLLSATSSARARCGSWVATPTGQVLVWQRCAWMQPTAIIIARAALV